MDEPSNDGISWLPACSSEAGEKRQRKEPFNSLAKATNLTAGFIFTVKPQIYEVKFIINMSKNNKAEILMLFLLNKYLLSLHQRRQSWRGSGMWYQ